MTQIQNTTNEEKLVNYRSILSDIAKDKGLDDLANYIKEYKESPKKNEVLSNLVGAPVYNITTMPEATCDGCQ